MRLLPRNVIQIEGGLMAKNIRHSLKEWRIHFGICFLAAAFL